MVCKKCGFINKEGASICINCGERLDGTLFCPKCHHKITKHDKTCPNCNETLSLEIVENNEKTLAKKSKTNVFQLIFAIASIVIFVSSISLIFSNWYFNQNGVAINSIYEIFSKWGNIKENISNLTNQNLINLVWAIEIIRTILACGNIIVSCWLIIFGIINSIKDIVNKNKSTSYRFLNGILVSNIFTYSFMMWSYQLISESGNISFNSDNSFVSNITLIIALLLFMSIFHIVDSHQRNRKSKTVEKSLFLSSYFILIFMLLFSSVPSVIFIDKSNDLNIYGIIAQYQNLLVSSNGESYFEGLTALCFISISLLIIIHALLVSSSIYFMSGFFSEKEERKSFKIPYYASSFAIAVISLIFLCTSLVASLMAYKDFDNVTPLMSIIVFALSTFLFVLSLVSLIFTKRNSKLDKFLKQKNYCSDENE